MDTSSLFIGMGIAAKILSEDMTVEEAIEILDPLKEKKYVESVGEQMKISARDLKAKAVLIKYAKEKLANESAEQNHGKWEMDECGEVFCSQCGMCVAVGAYEVFHNIKKSHKYCPNCGARMCGNKID